MSAVLIPNTGGPVLVGWVWKPVLVKKCRPCDLKAGMPLTKRKNPIRKRTSSVESATSRTPPRYTHRSMAFGRLSIQRGIGGPPAPSPSTCRMSVMLMRLAVSPTGRDLTDRLERLNPDPIKPVHP